MRIALYVHGSKEAAYEAGHNAGFKGEQLELFKHTGCEHKIEYEVNEQTGDSVAVKLDGRDIVASAPLPAFHYLSLAPAMPEQPRFIVAEASKTWVGKDIPVPPPADRMQTIGGKFEHIIGVNLRRGYKLHSFQLLQCMTAEDAMCETIIAVFELITQ